MQNLCDCSQKTDVILSRVSEYPANPVEWQMIIYRDSTWNTDNLKIYDRGERRQVAVIYDGGLE